MLVLSRRNVNRLPSHDAAVSNLSKVFGSATVPPIAQVFRPSPLTSPVSAPVSEHVARSDFSSTSSVKDSATDGGVVSVLLDRELSRSPSHSFEPLTPSKDSHSPSKPTF